MKPTNAELQAVLHELITIAKSIIETKKEGIEIYVECEDCGKGMFAYTNLDHHYFGVSDIFEVIRRAEDAFYNLD